MRKNQMEKNYNNLNSDRAKKDLDFTVAVHIRKVSDEFHAQETLI